MYIYIYIYIYIQYKLEKELSMTEHYTHFPHGLQMDRE